MVFIRRIASYWRYYAAFGGLVLVILIAGHAQRGTYNRNPAQQHRASPSPSSPATVSDAGPNYANACAKTETGGDQNLCIGRESLKAYKKQAFWAEASALIGIAGTVAILTSLIWTIKAVRATERSAVASLKQAEIAEKTLIAAHRPWIVVQAEIAGNATISCNDLQVNVKYTVANVGNSPALQVFLLPIVIDRTFNEPPAREFVNNVFIGNKDNSYFGYTIAPGSSREFRVTCGFQKDAYKAAMDRLQSAGFKNQVNLLWPMLVGYIEYRSFQSVDAHTTTFYFDIKRTRKCYTSDKSQFDLFWDVDEAYAPMGEIRLEESISPATEMT